MIITKRGIIKYSLVVIGTLVVGNFLLGLTIYNPAVALGLYNWLVRHDFINPVIAFERTVHNESYDSYPTISISRLQSNLFGDARAAVIGTVTDEGKINDGDRHVNVQDDTGHILVTEIVPEYPVPIPPVGTKLKIWGITRYDLGNRWWEIHPVFGWSKI